MTLKDDEEYEETPSSALEPGVKGVETSMQEDTDDVETEEPSGQPTADSNWERWYYQLQPLLGYLPLGAHEEDTEWDGPLSYRVEVASTAIGVSVGMAAASSGDMQLIMTLVALALGVGRVQQQFSETIEAQILAEPVHALAGVAIGYSAVHYDVLALLAGVGG